MPLAESTMTSPMASSRDMRMKIHQSMPRILPAPLPAWPDEPDASCTADAPASVAAWTAGPAWDFPASLLKSLPSISRDLRRCP